MRQLRLTIAYVAAFGLFLRALVPVGWMPNTGAERHSMLMPCPMMDGMMQMPRQSQYPAKHNPTSPHDGVFCRFGATAQYAPPPQIPVLQRHLLVAADAPTRFALAPALSSPLVWDHAARAPPTGT